MPDSFMWSRICCDWKNMGVSKGGSADTKSGENEAEGMCAASVVATQTGT